LTRRKRAEVVRAAKQIETASEAAAEAGTKHVADIIETLAQAAKDGDVGAASLVLRHVAPPSLRSVIRRAEHLADLPPDLRMREIAALAARGEISVEHATALMSLARAELETSVLQPLRAAIKALRAGEGTDRVLQRLMLALEELPQLQEPEPGQGPTTIEGEVTEDTADQ
jgi:hypothetical protein